MGRLLGIARRGAQRASMEEINTAVVSIETGLSGDYRGRHTGRQVTVLIIQDWQAACDELGAELPWTTRRANLLLDDIALPKSSGGLLKVGGCLLKITGETDPCERMDEQHIGLRAALTPAWRGGRTCNVVKAGEIRVGDSAQVIGV